MFDRRFRQTTDGDRSVARKTVHFLQPPVSLGFRVFTERLDLPAVEVEKHLVDCQTESADQLCLRNTKRI